MNIAEISLGLGGGGGIENYVRDLSLEFKKRDNSVLIAASRIDLRGFKGGLNTVSGWNGLKIARVKKYNLPLASIYSFGNNGSRILGKRKFEVVHAHSLPSPGYLGLKLKEKHHIPLVVTLHGGEVNILSEKPAFRKVNSLILERTDAVVAVSKDLQKRAAELFGVKSMLIPNAVDTDRFIPAPGVKKDIDLLYVGMLRQEKGLDILIKALKKMGKNCPRCVILGKGPMKSWIQKEVKKSGLQKKVTLKGFVHNQEMPALLNRSRAFVLPSSSEGMSIAVLEAMSAGVVPVVTDVGDHKLLIRDGKEGFVVPYGDTAALKRGISKALAMGEGGSRISKMARDRVRKKYSLKTVAGQYIQLFHESMHTNG